MIIRELDWLPEVIEKIEWKHGVTPREAEEACCSNPHVRRSRQGRYAVLGRTAAGRYLCVILAYLGKGRARPITARDMTGSQRDLYKRHQP